MEKITVKEALEQGYIRCGYDNTDFQHLMDISGLQPQDFESTYNGSLVVADNSPVTYSIDVSDIVDMITDKISEQEDINDENDMMIDYLDEYKDLEKDLAPIVEKINAFIGQHKIYFLTDIKLIP